MATNRPPRRGLGALVHGPPGHPLHPPLTDVTIGMFVLAAGLGVIGKAGGLDDNAGPAMWLALIRGPCAARADRHARPGGPRGPSPGAGRRRPPARAPSAGGD